jgi:hypothetical protein
VLGPALGLGGVPDTALPLCFEALPPAEQPLYDWGTFAKKLNLCGVERTFKKRLHPTWNIPIMQSGGFLFF